MISITEDSINICDILSQIHDETSGAISIFAGNVRNNNSGSQVVGIFYDVYPEMAVLKMQEIESEVLTKWNVRKFIALHRVGYIGVGETSVLVISSSEHRKEAFESCRYGIDNIKTRIPIWKKEIFENGYKWTEGVKLV